MKETRPKPPDLREARISQYAIGLRLRQLFDEVLNEPAPQEFLDILRSADEREQRAR